MKIISILFYSIFAFHLSLATRSVQVDITTIDRNTFREGVIINDETYIKLLDDRMYAGNTSYTCVNLIHFLKGVFTKPEINSLLEKVASGAYYFSPSIMFLKRLTLVYYPFYGYMTHATEDPHNIIFSIQIQGEQEQEEPIKKEFTLPLQLYMPIIFTDIGLINEGWLGGTGLDKTTDTKTEWVTDKHEEGGWSAESSMKLTVLDQPLAPSIEQLMNKKLPRKRLQNRPIPRTCG